MPKCSECGYLAVRNAKTLVIEEASDAFRENASITTAGNFYFHEERPLCFIRAISFTTLLQDDTSRTNVASAIKAERECDHFVGWTQGFSPKEHAEMVQQQAIREWQQKRDSEDREWRERQAAQEHQWRAEQAQRDRDWRNEDRKDMQLTVRRERIVWWAATAWTIFVTVVGWLLVLYAPK